MESYRKLYSLRVQHDYFEGKPCTAIGCRLTPQGIELARQRNLLFRQTAADEWTVYYDCNGAKFNKDDEILSLELYLADPNFTLYTEWKDFCPSDAYELELPVTETETNAENAILPSDKRRKIGSGFCSVSLHLANAMQPAPDGDKPGQAVLHFRSQKLKWEYIFFQRNGNSIPETGLKLEDANKQIAFTDLKPETAYGRKGMSVTTEEAIPMRATYGSRLRLILQEESKPKRIVLANIEPPIPGRFVTGKGLIRQICYY
mgnify:CR=1 FL=1